MTKAPRSIELERQLPERNMARFYVVELEHDLFGMVVARRRWGRIGSTEQSRTTAFVLECDAWAMLQRMEQAKRRRGYVDRPLRTRTDEPEPIRPIAARENDLDEEYIRQPA